jgi:hypothetical protein
MTLGALSREEPGAGCFGRAESQNKGAPLGSTRFADSSQVRCSLIRSDQASSKAEMTNTT